VFSYVDENIRRNLEADDRLVYLDVDGKVIDPGDPGRQFLSLLGPIPLPRVIGGAQVVLSWYAFVRRVELHHVMSAAAEVGGGGQEAFRSLLQQNMSVNSVIASPGFAAAKEPLVRIHSCCMTGDVFGSLRCECGPQLEAAFSRIVEEGGAVVYMSGHEGRGIGLWAKAITYLLQDAGQDTYQANLSLGLPEDSRDFSDAAVVLRHLLPGRPIRLLSNNPLKRVQMEQNGQPVSEMITHVAGLNEHNLRYLRSKKSKGHDLPGI
jgi:GTP cyclohydrolase II